MISFIPSEVQQQVSEILDLFLQKKLTLVDFSRASGGCINNGGRLITAEGNFFVKWNDAVRFPGMFKAEQSGLNLLRESCEIQVPRCIGSFEGEHFQVIVLEYIDSSDRSLHFSTDLGRKLAILHGKTHADFGLDHDNYIGSLSQFNHTSTNWIEFFIRQRLAVQFQAGCEAGFFGAAEDGLMTRLYQELPSIIPPEKPALLHGDLWSGNVMTNSEGMACLIDPAVYYGHREAELSFTKLFGGFDLKFYESYNEAFPLSPGFKQRVDIFNLYPLLVHTNLFGSGYASQVRSILKRFS